MQDRYAGDVGDFGKYGLLRSLAGEEPPLRLGVVWYLTDKLTGARDPVNDGRHVSYLQPPREHLFRDCDPELYEAMRRLITSGERSVATVEALSILPSAALTHRTRIATPPSSMGRAQRLRARQRWLDAALHRTAACDLVFVDPDNGLETLSVPTHSSRAPKYAYLSELEPFVRRGQTLMVYHHLGRRPHVPEILARAEQCSTSFSNNVIALRYRRGTSRAFLIVPAPQHEVLIRSRITAMLAGPWSRHFELVPSPKP